MKIVFVFGTRPEAIKMAPLIKEFQKYSEKFKVLVCLTAQHREMLDQVLDFFSIKSDYDLNLMSSGQTLTDISVRALAGLEKIFQQEKPDLVFVQGDTSTTFIGALASYYNKIKIAHLEAGLRSGNLFSPFPEEGNRLLTGRLADFHFTPTKTAENNLNREGITKNIWTVGNTVIDALYLSLDIVKEQNDKIKSHFEGINFDRRVILVTGHRRESFGKSFEVICQALREIAINNPMVEIIYPVHLNPNVKKPVYQILSDIENVKLIAPLSYPHMIWLMKQSYIVLTDSGGIQEEAPALGKPVLVMRDVTERMEGIEAGTALLVGTEGNRIIQETERLLNDLEFYNKMANAVNPYGDGTTSEKVVRIISNNIDVCKALK